MMAWEGLPEMKPRALNTFQRKTLKELADGKLLSATTHARVILTTKTCTTQEGEFVDFPNEEDEWNP
jgi:hypothetical protein